MLINDSLEIVNVGSCVQGDARLHFVQVQELGECYALAGVGERCFATVQRITVECLETVSLFWSDGELKGWDQSILSS